jgi:3-phenylpropionate/trans-cinnamate dioxygenase ferredoxin subunit
MSADPFELGDLSDLHTGAMRVFPDLGPHGVLVCRVAGTLYAVANNCSHRDTPLCDGRLRGVLITCPLHGAQFDVRDGAQQGPPAFTPIASYAVTEVDGIATIQLGD